MKIIADENMPLVEQIFSEIGEVQRVAGRSMSRADVGDADLLLVRSVTSVNAELLAGSRVQFVGTATIGTDHVDQHYLQQQGIGFSSAPGCNADAVVDYVLSALFHLAEQQGFDPFLRTYGVVGVGNVGGRLAARLQRMGCRVLLNDPPRAAAGEAGFVALEQVLAEADVICLHTPLTRDGSSPTHHLLAEAELSSLRQGALLINAGRGPVIDNAALLKIADKRPDLTWVLDVWEHEPEVDSALAGRVAIATPHIAGYSHDGKIRGTYMLYEAYCRFAGVPVKHALAHFLPQPAVRKVEVTAAVMPLDLIRMRYDPFRDDRALRQTLHMNAVDQALAFDRLRKNYPQRREFSSLTVCGALSPEQRQMIGALGFNVATGDEIP